MRRRLVLVALAVTTMVAIAFVLPLGLLIRNVARDRALVAAERDANAVAPILALGVDRSLLEAAMLRTEAGRDGRMRLELADGSPLGPEIDGAADEIELARRGSRAFAASAGDGALVVLPVLQADGRSAVVAVLVPDELLSSGVARSWLVLGMVGVVLVVAAVIVNDRLSRSVSRPLAELVRAAERLGRGDLDARVGMPAPSEIEQLIRTFNSLASQVTTLLERERELVADLAHRLRTPLMALRLELDRATPDGDARIQLDRLERAVDELIRDARRSRRDGPSVCDAAEVVAARADYWSALADDQGRPWRLDVADGPLLVALDEETLTDAVDALLGNVFAHTPESTPFSVTVRRDGMGAVIDVEDRGPGFGSDDPTPRGHSGSGSTGLGLDIARRAAETAGGSLELVNGRSEGGHVQLRLPLVADPRER